MTDSEPREAIQRAVASIPAGRVASYGHVARMAGLPGRARLVGRVLKETPDQLALPWHRVLKADGRPAFPEGSEAFMEQIRRLQREGVELVGDRVPRDRMLGADANLDQALWGPPRELD